ncbi:hypothetical protein [Nonomuraea sp. NPDC050643]|uniref:hypothetical protein n=1 Tax=Nonomuraea sp. NPDC050643 TaxID=3155660 RepID=UPI0033D41F66
MRDDDCGVRERVGQTPLQAVHNALHLLCGRCGTVTDVGCAAEPCLEPADAAGHGVDEAGVTYWDVCPSCQR